MISFTHFNTFLVIYIIIHCYSIIIHPFLDCYSIVLVCFGGQCVEWQTCMLVERIVIKVSVSLPASGKNLRLTQHHCCLHMKMDDECAAVCGMCYSCLHKSLHYTHWDEYKDMWISPKPYYAHSISFAKLQIKVQVTHTHTLYYCVKTQTDTFNNLMQ